MNKSKKMLIKILTFQMVFVLIFSVLLIPSKTTFSYANNKNNANNSPRYLNPPSYNVLNYKHKPTGHNKTTQHCNNPYQKLGDTNDDFVIDSEDLKNLSTAFGTDKTDPLYKPNCDFNKDGEINGMDLIILSEHFEKDYRFDDWDSDGINNITEKILGTDITKTSQYELSHDKELSYIANFLKSNNNIHDTYSLLIASKTLKFAIEQYPFNSPPIQNNSTIMPCCVHTKTIARFFTKYDLLKDEGGLQIGLLKVKRYIFRNITHKEKCLFYKLIKEDVDSIKNAKDLNSISQIARSLTVNLYISQIKTPGDFKIINNIKQMVRNVYLCSDPSSKVILDKYILQARLHDFYNDQTLAYAILKNSDKDLAQEIYQHPKTFLALTFNARPYICMNSFFTKKWRRQLNITNIQVKLKNGEFKNLVTYETNELNSTFKREKKINEIRKKYYKNSFSLEDYFLSQLLFTFDKGDYETFALIQYYSKYITNYHTLLKALFDTANNEDKMFDLLVKFYNLPNFSFFKNDQNAAENIILIFEQNFNVWKSAKERLPYDLNGKLVQDSRDWHIWLEEDLPKVDFDKVWDTDIKILTPNDGFKYYGVCQMDEALAKRVFNTMLLPFVSYDGSIVTREGLSGHAYSGIFLKDGIWTGVYFKNIGYGYNFKDYTITLITISWALGFGDSLFGSSPNRASGTYGYIRLVIRVNKKLPSEDPSIAKMMNVLKSNSKFYSDWYKYYGNYIPIDMFTWMLEKGTTFITLSS